MPARRMESTDDAPNPRKRKAAVELEGPEKKYQCFEVKDGDDASIAQGGMASSMQFSIGLSPRVPRLPRSKRPIRRNISDRRRRLLEKARRRRVQESTDDAPNPSKRKVAMELDGPEKKYQCFEVKDGDDESIPQGGRASFEDEEAENVVGSIVGTVLFTIVEGDDEDEDDEDDESIPQGGRASFEDEEAEIVVGTSDDVDEERVVAVKEEEEELLGSYFENGVRRSHRLRKRPQQYGSIRLGGNRRSARLQNRR